ncbi:MAG: CBS domain-containing protein [Planctomycetota bacterium]
MTPDDGSDIRALASTPVTIDASASVAEAAQELGKQHVGSLVVVDAGEPIGLVTDRDLTMAALLRPPGSAPPTVGSVASRPLLSVDLDASLVDATLLFQRHCIRRIGVRNASGALVGVLSADSVLQALGGRLADIAQALAREFDQERSPLPAGSSTFGSE